MLRLWKNPCHLYEVDFEQPQNLQYFYELSEQVNNQEAGFWENADTASSLLKKFSSLKTKYDSLHDISQSYQETLEIYQRAKATNDLDLIQQCYSSLLVLSNELNKLELLVLLSNPTDNSNCFLEVHSGAGGTEANDWAHMLLNMYLKWAKKNKLTSEIISISPGEDVGIKSAIVKISGDYAYGLLKTEEGVHRLVRLSPFDANKKRHTSFGAVSVYSEVPEVAIEIADTDLKIDTYRASGAGGQHVNKTDSAVRITHLPTGTVVQSQSDRSQLKNRAQALKMLRAKLSQKHHSLQAENKKKDYQEKSDIGWGYRARSYVLHPYRLVKDLRTSLEHSNPDEVLSGDLNGFIQQMLVRGTD